MDLLKMLPQMLIDGLSLGFVYAIVALGYTMVYGALGFINFANSEIFMSGAFIGAEVLVFMVSISVFGNSFWLVFIVALLVSLVFTGLLGMAIERVAYRPLRKASKLVPLISAFGVSYFLQDVVRMIEGLARNSFYLTVPQLFNTMIPVGDFAVIPVRTVIIIGACLLSLLALNMFINKTHIGGSIRAVAQDSMVSSLLGIDVNKTISFTFFVGAGMGGVAGTLFAIQYGMIHPFIGVVIGIKAFTAAVLGGIGNISGAMLGGVLLGVVEALGSGYLSALSNGAFGAEYKDVFAFIVLILILILKPNGLLGKAVADKA